MHNSASASEANTRTPECKQSLEPGKRQQQQSIMHLSCVNTSSSAAATDHWSGRKNKASTNTDQGEYAKQNRVTYRKRNW